MTPKGGYTGDIGGNIMSANDITRLQRAYSCKEESPYTYNGCGGFRYSATGGAMDGTQANGCSWILKTDPEKGITITFTGFTIPGDCSSEYLEVRAGTAEDGPLVGKYCGDSPPPSSLATKHNALYVKYVKKASGSTATWEATWTTSAMTCCAKVVYEKSSLGGSYSLVSGENFNGFPVYKQDDGDKYMVACPKFNQWVIVDSDYASSEGSCPAFYQKAEDGGAYCPQDIIGEWKNGNGNGDITGSTVRCSDCALYPAETECASCCSQVNFSGTNSEWAATGFYSGYFQGGWTANGKTTNGLQEYVSDKNAQYCMWYSGSQWIINDCSSSGGSSGFVFGKGDAGMKCAEQANDWSFYSQNGNGVIDDATMKAECASSCAGDPPATPDGGSTNWDSSTKLGGTVVTYTCSSGEQVKAVCDAATLLWKPTSITCTAGGGPPPTSAPVASTPSPAGKTTKKAKKPTGKKPTGKKPSGKKPSGKKPAGKKPAGSKKPKPGKKPAGAKKPKPGKKPTGAKKPKPAKKPAGKKPSGAKKPKPAKKPKGKKGKKGKKGR